MLVQLGETAQSSKALARIAYLRRTQLAEGSWYAAGDELRLRHVVGAVRASTPPKSTTRIPAIRKAVAGWSRSRIEDGGWGEDAISYRLDYKGFEGAPRPPRKPHGLARN